jgi:predicted tellurium resistance membrane protein TerC
MFIGIKMLISGFYGVPIGFSLAVVAAILVGAAVLSLLRPPQKA